MYSIHAVTTRFDYVHEFLLPKHQTFDRSRTPPTTRFSLESRWKLEYSYMDCSFVI